MLYFAWADGELSDAEIRSICSFLTDIKGVDKPCQHLLGRWLDPENPPSSGDLTALLFTIRKVTSGLAPEQRRSLTDLGVGLAQSAGREISDVERQALTDLERTLSLGGGEIVRRLLMPGRPVVAASEPEPIFDVRSMSRLLDGDQHELRERVRQLLSQSEFAYLYDLSTEDFREIVLKRVRLLADEGIGALSFPVEFGGAGDMGGFIAAFETVAFGDLSVLIKMGVQFGLFGGSILQLGTESHHAAYLPIVGTLELPGCFAMTETGHGSNVFDLQTVARYDKETQEFVVHTPSESARKDYIGNAACHGQMATVFAQLEVDGDRHGVHALLVPIRDSSGAVLPGIRVEDCGEKMGLNGVDNGRIWFDGVRVPRQNLLDRFAHVTADGEYTSPIASPAKRFFTMLGTLVGGRVSVALGGLSAAKSALTIAIFYGARRRQFGSEGEPETVLLDYRTHQRRLMPQLSTTYALDFALKYLVRRYVESTDEDRREIESLTAGLKAYSTWHATDTIQECREACGGQGYLAENRFAALKADTDVFTTFEGDNTVLLQLVAKSLLTGFRRQFSEMGVLGLARYIAGHAATAVAELNPVTTRRTDEDHLRSRDFQLAALEWRQEHLLVSLAKAIKKRLDQGLDSFEALNEVQNHATALAIAHVELVVLQQFTASIEECDDESLSEILNLMCDLYSLHRIEAARGWFQAHGYIEAPKAKAIRKLIDRLCFDVRLQAGPLVDAFSIPQAMLGAPIAMARFDSESK